MKARIAALLGLLIYGTATAQQYESEARVLSREEAAQPQEEFDAEEALEKAEGNPYAQAMILRELAGKAMKAGDEASAAKYLKRALDKGGLSEYAAQEMQKELAVLLAAQEDYGAVVRELAPILAKEKKPAPELLLVLGGAYAQLGQYGKALPLLQQALKQTRKPPHDWYALLAAAHAGLKQWQPAIENLEKALQQKTDELAYWQQLAGIHIQRKDSISALAALEMAYRLDLFKDSRDRMQFAQLFFANGVPFEAASLIQEGLESGEVANTPQAQEMLAAAWVAAKEFTLAVPALMDAVESNPKAELYLQLGQISFDRNDFDLAARSLREGIRRGAGRQAAAAQMMLGVALYQQQDFSAAREAFLAASESKGMRENAKQWIAYLDSGLAREEAIRMAAKRPQDAAEVSGRFSGDKVRYRRAASGGRGGAQFTPVGAQQGSNADNSIPAWTGGLNASEFPADFNAGQRLIDPYPQDKPLYEITADNWKEHKDKLSLGHRALLSKYKDYRLPVYTSRRTVAYPEEIYEATQSNRGRAKLLGSDALTGARLGFPFPAPKNGVEIMWNHRARFRGNSAVFKSRQVLVLANGTLSEQFQQTEKVLYRYANIEQPADLSKENMLLYYLTYFSSSSADLAFVALVHESANSMQKSRAIWVMPRNISKLFRIPPVGYDNPFPGSGGLAFVDMIDMYNGAFDRYDWKLLGKREVLLPYNAYRLNDGKIKNEDLLQARFMNPERTRYEMHRVWLIEANERGGKKHSFGARRFYVDEDSWNVVLVENYDRQGQLWRFQEGHLLPNYEVKWANAMPVVTYDLKDGRYFINRLTNDDEWATFDGKRLKQKEFLPSSVKARYAR